MRCATHGFRGLNAPRPRFSRSWEVLLLRQGADVPVAPILDPEPTTSGTLSIDPSTAIAGEWGTWTLRYEVGDQGIDELGGLRVGLPEAFHAGIRNSAFRMQASHPREPNFVAANASRPGVVLQTVVEFESDAAIDKSGRLNSLSGLAGYYDSVTRVIVRRGRLERGDVLSIVFGDTSGASQGFRAGVLRFRAEPVAVAVDHEGFGRFRLHAGGPTLEVLPAWPVELLIASRSDAVVGEPTALKIALVDGYANAASTTAAWLRFEILEGVADFPATADLEAGRGWLEVPWTPRKTGVLRIRAFDDTRHLVATSNPVLVHAERPSTQVYWGDLHSHTQISGDGLGSGADAYDYARHVSALDFYSRTDHGCFFDDGDDVADFGAYVELAERHDAPGEFATIHGYETSFAAPWGHHNVYFRDCPIQTPDEYAITLPELWKALRGHDALTIPHHTLKMPAVVDWTNADDPEQRRNFEIFSAHGLSEAFDPTHPLAIEQSLFTNASTTQRRGTSAQKAWEDGLQLSTIASSDDHRAHPGMPHQGVVALRATGLTRQAVFDALRERRTWATTGARILLDFSVGDLPMGGRGRANRPLEIRGSAVGSGVITLVEILRHVAGGPGFAVIGSLHPDADRVEWAIPDDPGPGAAIYYVRLRQRRLVRGVPAMAWSSPIWVDPVEGKR